jgi:hypothetical protein
MDSFKKGRLWLISLALLLLLLFLAMSEAVAAEEQYKGLSGNEVKLRPLSEAELEAHSGGQATGFQVINDSVFNADISNNALDSGSTGDNAVNDSAFTNLSGLALIIQNSGNNVIIQNTTIIAITMTTMD